MMTPALRDEPAVHAALRRAGAYRLLGLAFAYPGPDRLEAVAEVAEMLVPAVEAPLGLALGQLAAAARDADAAAVAAEYVFVFDRGAKCPLYEGAWGDAPQLAGKAALLADIAGFYTAFGLQPASVQPDMEDHIAAECEFMSALALKEGYALAEGDDAGVEITQRAQRSFLSDHLGRWAATFCDALKEATPLPYYGVLADLLAAWVRVETAQHGISPLAVRGRVGYDPVQEEDAFTCPMAEPEPPEGDP